MCHTKSLSAYLLFTSVLSLTGCKMVDSTLNVVNGTAGVVNSALDITNRTMNSTKALNKESAKKLTTPIIDICKEGIQNPLKLEDYRGMLLSDSGVLTELSVDINGGLQYDKNGGDAQFQDYDIRVDAGNYAIYGVVDREFAKKLTLDKKAKITGVIENISSKKINNISYDANNGVFNEDSVICFVRVTRTEINQ